MAKQVFIVDGIKVNFNPLAFIDRDAVKMNVKVSKNVALMESGKIKDDSLELAEMANENTELSEQYFNFVFGEKQFKKIQDEIRKKNDGVCTEEMLANFIAKLKKQIPELKN